MQHGVQQAIAYTPIGNKGLGHIQNIKNALENRNPPHDKIGPLKADTRMGNALRLIHGPQFVHQMAHFLAFEGEAMNP
jgi:hypothetical protein